MRGPSAGTPRAVSGAMRFTAVAVAVLLASGCISDREESRSIDEAIHLRLGASSGGLRVGIDWTYNVTDPCPVLRDDFTARVGDIAMTVAEPGHWTGEFDGANECAQPTVTVTDAPLATASFELEDGAGMVRCDLGSALEPRTATLVPDGPWEIAAGERMTVRWSHPADAASSLYVNLVVGEFRYDVTNVETPDDLISFTIPASLQPGGYRLQLTRSRMFPGERCDGIETDRHDSYAVTQLLSVTP